MNARIAESRFQPGSAARAECAHALRELILASERLRLVTAQHLGLSITESLTVSYLLVEGPQGQTELAGTLAMTTGSMTALIDRLEARDFVERTPHPTDRRRSIIRLTSNGERLLAQSSGWTTEAFQAVDLDDYASTATTLHAIAGGLRSSADTILARGDASADPSPLR